ncbi:MoaD/ThiS family protein [Flexithrix dorotheae]|uniref:MoaD/ThiS family protein n=1 Tax=Flexithrix dorotheae TaxID=70993 RepID=UPI00035E19A7|nr:MoaD/ThiS family protein [Flexithrix dorotheae]
MAQIIIPTPLRKFTDNLATIKTNGSNIQESMLDLATQYPEVKQHLFDESGALRKFVRIYIGDEDIKALQNENTPVEDNTEISIIPAIAGGIA